ncbi:hypothetical protein LIX22_002977 (plasmid) [Clavibacter nebraskensis]|uniref:hypothetical protein n=1 Tax=Clavibacter nebraskensis TaxID=31963 RepID=UPI00200D4DE2|nr:hypothetical protein [Clavibacter nebraskensis]UQB17841.1 hypothetical protein LIX22_002977 [Clavibacter nebraskensis]
MKLGIAAHDTFVNDEAGARYVQFNPTAGHIDDAYEGARAIAAQLIERGDVSRAAVSAQCRDYGELLMLTAEQRTTLPGASARSVTRPEILTGDSRPSPTTSSGTASSRSVPTCARRS